MSGAVFYAIFYASSTKAFCGLRLKVTNKMLRPMTSVSTGPSDRDEVLEKMREIAEKVLFRGHVKEF